MLFFGVIKQNSGERQAGGQVKMGRIPKQQGIVRAAERAGAGKLQGENSRSGLAGAGVAIAFNDLTVNKMLLTLT